MTEQDAVAEQLPSAVQQTAIEGVVDKLLSLMSLDISIDGAQVEGDDQERLRISLSGEDAATLIGRQGRTLDAVQFVLNMMIRRGNDGPLRSVILDIEGYRERRLERLRRLAQEAATRVLKEGREVRLEEMNAHDRRVIHMTAGEISGVTTRSVGDGLFKEVIVEPAFRVKSDPI